MMTSARTTYHALRPEAPVRAWVLACLALVIGVVGLVLGWNRDLVPIWIAGAALVLAGLFLALIARSFVSSRTLHVTLDSDGFLVSGPGYRREGQWADVDSVHSPPDGSRLVIASGPVKRVYIQAPGGVADERMMAVTKDIANRLRVFHG